MISINNIYYGFGERYIFEDASVHITPNDKIALIGRNGKGKTTLLRLIVGDSTIESGTIEKSKDCKIGFLNQDLLSYKSDSSILRVAMEAFSDALKVQTKMDVVLKKMEENFGFDAYGLSEEMPDPVARSIRSILDHMHVVDERMNTMCKSLSKLDQDYQKQDVPSIDEKDLDCFKEAR